MTIAALNYVGPISPSSADLNSILLKLNEIAAANSLSDVFKLVHGAVAGDDYSINSVIVALNMVLASLSLPLHPLISDPLTPSGGQLNGIIARVNDAVFATNNPSAYALPLIEGFQNFALNVPTGGLRWTSNQSHFGAGGTLVSSTLHPAAGQTHSGLFETTPSWNEIYTGNEYGGEGYTKGLNLTGYTSVKLDAYITQADSSDALVLAVANNIAWTGGTDGSSAGGATGQVTVTADISGFSDKTNMVFSIENFNETEGTFTAYLQKLYAA